MELVLKYFPNLKLRQKEQLEALLDLYADWNEKINVISRKDIEHLYLRHVLHSLAIAKFIQFKPNTQIIDVGTGGGFPGIPLAILFPDSHFTLLDAIGKKIKVVNAVSEGCGLRNVKGIHNNVSNIHEQFDFVVSRAVSRLESFVPLVRKNIFKKQKNAIPNGLIYLKGGDLDDELKPFKKNVHVEEIPSYFEEDFFETKKIVFLPLS